MHCDQWVTAVPPCHLVWERGRERERDNQPRGRLAKAMAVSLLVGEVLLSPLTWQSFKLQPVKGSLAKHCGIMHWLTDWLTTVCPDNGPHSLPFQLRKRVGMRGERGPCLPLLNLHSSSEQRVPSSLAPARACVSSRLLASLRCSALLCLSVSLPLRAGSCWSTDTQMRVCLTGVLPTDCCTNAEPGYSLLAYSGEPGCCLLDVFVLLLASTGKRKKKSGENTKKNILLTRFFNIISVASSSRSSCCIVESSHVWFVNESFLGYRTDFVNFST